MALMGGLKDMLIDWLGIIPTDRRQQMVIREYVSREVDVLKNTLWYRGEPSELEQYYKQLVNYGDGMSTVAATRFWASVPADNNLIRKFHSGIPRIIADTLAGIVLEDMNELDAEQDIKSRWEIIADEDFDDLLKDAISKTLAEGDGAFKVAVDPEISDKPLVEFYSGNAVEYVYKRGKLIEIKFLTDYFNGTKKFQLIEHYGKGYVNYILMDDKGNECDIDVLDETADLQDITFEGDFIMGVPLRFRRSAKWDNRGDSIFEGKGDIFDALDECLSTWLDALRAGRVKQYIPEVLIPRNEHTGALKAPDVFNPYYATPGNLAEDMKETIQVKQGVIDYEGLLTTYVTLLDCALQGIISPSTLGIDVKKLDNAEAQREKEKTTMYTRDTLIGSLYKALPRLVDVVLKTEDNMLKNIPPDEYACSFEWGQYANPSFEAMVETVGKAKTMGIMSIERCVEELYGDTIEKEEKIAEVERLKAEEQVNQPSLGDEMYELQY